MPESFKVDYQMVKNMITKATHQHQRLDTDVITSMRKWVAKLKAMEWHVMSRVTVKPEAKVIIGFLSPWQKQQIQLHGNNLLCINSTHNTTKIIPQFGVKKLSTFTVLLRQPDTGRGLPVAWFLTSDETA